MKLRLNNLFHLQFCNLFKSQKYGCLGFLGLTVQFTWLRIQSKDWTVNGLIRAPALDPSWLGEKHQNAPNPSQKRPVMSWYPLHAYNWQKSILCQIDKLWLNLLVWYTIKTIKIQCSGGLNYPVFIRWSGIQ